MSAADGSQPGSRSAFEVIKATRPGTWRCTAKCFTMADAVLARARVGSFPAKHLNWGAGGAAGHATNTLSNNADQRSSGFATVRDLDRL